MTKPIKQVCPYCNSQFFPEGQVYELERDANCCAVSCKNCHKVIGAFQW